MLVRLAGLEVERERRTLSGLEDAIAQVRQQIAIGRAEAECERRGAVDMAGARLLAAYLEASRRRLAAADAARAGLERARAQQVACLLERRLELKRLELIRQRHEQRRQAEALRRERRELDELAVLGAARRRR